MKRKIILSSFLCILFTFCRCENDSTKPSLSRSTSVEQSEESEFVLFETKNYWNETQPVLANGHVGFVPYMNSIFMNGLYDGYKDRSHRARIPNYANVQFQPCTKRAFHSGLTTSNRCVYSLDIYNGVFRTKTNVLSGKVSVEHTQYPHRYFEHAIVNHIKLKRNENDNKKKRKLYLFQNIGTDSEELTIKSSRTIQISNRTATIIEESTKSVEDLDYQRYFTNVTILHDEIPSDIALFPGQNEAEFIWTTIIKQNSTDIETLFRELHENHSNLFKMHASEWQRFWKEKRITVEGDAELSKTIDASLFAIASALPSLITSRPRSQFYGICPAGLGLRKDLEVYNGHSFWDTETWMQPVIMLLEPKWSKELLNYRYTMRNSARDNALKTGYKGYRFPWESAFTGVDVTPNAPEIVEFEQHITADIGHALRQDFFATRDLDWFERVGCDLAFGIAEFWESRVTWNKTTQRYDINGVMGPDEHHADVNNNAFTNVAAALALHFGSFASCVCNKLNPTEFALNEKWASIAKNITLLYNRELDYYPEFDGYELGTMIKQADAVLLGYPMHVANMEESTRLSNLKLYSNLTKLDGPAMTWSMHAIGHLYVDSEPPTQKDFERTYAPYMRPPFYQWNEYMTGVPYGANNFITGAGGFLQLIINGYTGIRINSDSLTIRNPQLAPNTNKLQLNGIHYMKAKCEIVITQQKVWIKIEGRNLLHVYIDNVEQDTEKDSFEFGLKQSLKLSPKDASLFESCPAPEDTVGILEIVEHDIPSVIQEILNTNK